MALMDYFNEQLDTDLASEVNAKPFIPTGKYTADVVSWKEGVFSEKFRAYANEPHVKVTFKLFGEDGEVVGMKTQDLTWIEVRNTNGSPGMPTKLWYQLAGTIEGPANTIGDVVNYLEAKPRVVVFGMESIKAKVKDLSIEEQDIHISSGRGMDDDVYVTIRDDEVRESLMDKGYDSNFNILNITPFVDDIPF